MHLTGAHVFTDGQPFTLTASISPLTVYAVFQDTRDPSPRSSPRFVRPRRRGDGQRTVEQAFCNVTSFPSPLVRRGSHEVRTIIVPTRSIAISISKQSPRESLRLMRHYIYAARNRGGFLRAERTLCAPLPRILFSERDVFRVPGQRAVSAASLCSPVPMIYAPPPPVILIIIIIIPALFVYRST